MKQVAVFKRLDEDFSGQDPECIWKIFKCGLIAALVFFGGCGSRNNSTGGHHDPEAGPSGGLSEVRRGLPGEPQTLDPQLADDTFSFQVVRDMYEGLTAEDRGGQIVPGVASSWTIDASGTTYTFQLRPDAKWSDGEGVIAEEFVQGLRRAVDPHTPSGSAALLSIIRGAVEITAGRRNPAELRVTAFGNLTLQIELEHPAPFILQILSQPIAAPVHISKHGTPVSERSGKPITNGPYQLISRIPNSNIHLIRNPFYWDLSNVAISDVRYVNTESESTELKEYIAGQLDMTFTIPTSDFHRVSEQFGSQVQIAPILGTFYLALNLSRPEISVSRDVRQALSMAVNRVAIAEHLAAGVIPAYSFVAKGISQYVPPIYYWATWARSQQLTVARSLLKKAGYSPNHKLKLKMYFNRDEGLQRIMVAIAEGWKQDLGADTELESDEFRVFLAGRKDKTRWDVARLAWNADYDDPASFLEVFASGNSENDPSYQSPEFDALIDKARAEPHPNERMDFLQEAEQLLLGDYPIIPVYFYSSRRLVKPYIGGAQITPMNHSYSKHLYWASARL